MSGSGGSQPGGLSPQTISELDAVAADATVTGFVNMTKAPSVMPMFLRDVERAVKRYFDQADLLEQLGIDQPMVEYKSGVRAVLDALFSQENTPFIDPGRTDTLAQAPQGHISDMVYMAKLNARRAGFKVSDENVTNARTWFRSALSSFLRQRTMTAGGALGPSGPASSGKGGSGTFGTLTATEVAIEVSTTNQNLHVLSAPAFFPNVRTQFGSGLSTPVKGNINPGLYVFGGYNATIAVAFEPYPFNVPPTLKVPVTVV
jgi:hypothetical protein